MQASQANANNIRPSQRNQNQLREVEIIRHYTKHAEGSVLVKFGDTHVLCTASVEERVPGFLKVKAKAGLPQNMVCCRAQPVAVWIEKRHAVNNLAVRKRFNA